MKDNLLTRCVALSATTMMLLPLGSRAATGDFDTFDPNLSGEAYSIATQPDGKVLLGGYFLVGFPVMRTNIARFSTSGVLETNFNAGSETSDSINCIAVQPDGKMLLGGFFFSLSGVAQRHLARINADGSLDTNFSPVVSSAIYGLALQPDGRILIGGDFVTVNGSTRSRIARLNSDGTLDSTFNPGASDTVNTLAVQADGKVLVGGRFTTLGGSLRSRIGRLNGNGSLDTSFNAAADNTVSCLAVQADGRILVAGPLSTNNFWRLNTDGTLDTNFNPNVSSAVNTIALQADGKILIGGFFTSVGGVTRDRFARLNIDGTLDPLNPFDISDPIKSVALQADGKILAANPGRFVPPVGQQRLGLVRLVNDAATQTLIASSATRVQWLRGGSAPEAQSTTFELSTNGGATYTLLGNGTRISGGWELTGLTLPATGQLRARARTIGGEYGSSISLVERIAYFGPMTGADNLSAAESYTEDTPLNLAAIVAHAAEMTNITATLTLSTTNAGSLSTNTSGAATSTYNPNTGVWTASGPSADVNTLLAGVIFRPATNFNANFTIGTSVTDGVNTFTGTKTMTGTPVNDPPTATNLAATEHYTEDIPLDLIDIVVGDVDSANVTATLTLSKTNAGILSTATSGATTSTYDSNTGVWTASGPIADVNALLAGVTFYPATNYNSNFTIATRVTDGIAAAITGNKSVIGTAVNDPPTATNLSAAETFTEDTPLNLVDIVGSDIDSPNVVATLILSNPNAGRLNTGTSGGATSTFNANNGTWLASGPLAGVNTLLAGVTFTPSSNYNANFTIFTRFSDGFVDVNGSKAMTGTPVNDPPIFTKGSDKSHPFGTTNAQTFVAWATGIDDGDPEITQALTFSVTNSNPSLFTTLPNVAANGTLTYTPKGSSGTATIGVSLTDDATAGGSALTSAVQTFTITVEARPPERPLIDRSRLLGDGSFQLSFTNTNNVVFSVLAATNVTLPVSNWMYLGVTTNAGGGLHRFTDVDATNFANRFYLLRFP